jgi:hypothetical protein
MKYQWKEWLPPKPRCLLTRDVVSVEIRTISSAFFLLVFGLFASVSILIIEKLSYDRYVCPASTNVQCVRRNSVSRRLFNTKLWYNICNEVSCFILHRCTSQLFLKRHMSLSLPTRSALCMMRAVRVHLVSADIFLYSNSFIYSHTWKSWGHKLNVMGG